MNLKAVDEDWWYCDGDSVVINVQQVNLKMPVRDLRVLDKAFMAEDSSNLLVREQCMVLSMEHVRIIITPDAVYAPVDTDMSEVGLKFLQRLEAQALRYSQTLGSMEPAGQCFISPVASVKSPRKLFSFIMKDNMYGMRVSHSHVECWI